MTQKLKSLVAVFAAGTLLLAGCGLNQQAKPSGKPVGSLSEAKEKGGKQSGLGSLEAYYAQKIEWESCESNQAVQHISDGTLDDSGFTCATIQVPLDYQKPEGESIKLQLARFSTSETPRTPMLYNPGGPGGSAIANLNWIANANFTQRLTQNFDVVAVDPRGVGTSTPVKCLTDEEIDQMRSGDWGTKNPDEIAGAKEDAAKYSELCLERGGEIVKFVDTDSVVRDFDVVRAALGQEKLTYFGYSYGTYLGALYADTFPEKVGKFVLDGAVDPALSADQIAAGQAGGFEESLTHFLEVTAAEDPSFPFKGADAKTQFKKWLESIDETPLKTTTPDRPLTGDLARAAILGGMYSTDMYQFVAEGIKEAYENNNGSQLLNLTDLINDRNSDGTYKDNSFDAFNVINNLDYRAEGTEADWKAQKQELIEKYPLVGDQFVGASAILAGWKIEPKYTRRTVVGKGAAPILVVGTLHDPATPYAWSVSLASQLESAKLITVDAWGHGAYSQTASSCLTSAVDDYFIEDKVPAVDLKCEG